MYNTDMPTRAELPTTPQLLRSTAIAVATASALLVTVVLPSEYGFDPTGIGRVLGLAQMGEIKQQLIAEADSDATTATGEAPPFLVAEISDEAVNVVPSPGGASQDSVRSSWRDTVTLTLAPDEAAEIKLTMKQGEVAIYEWTAAPGHVNFDLHADGANESFTSYSKGRSATEDSGEFTAAFDGAHGWYWRNRSGVAVDVTLRTKGAYSQVRRVI
ncbi:MAG: transmembrane anchor protein [Hyphomonadaceae bacterium BRH_c29]|nr:MAG: transmembrane anchor protein [Hyphomonadaceae bacterium BRH_c29]